MAKLHLLIDLNEVTDAEFRALCDALERKARQARRRARAARCSRARRDGESARDAPRLAMPAGCAVARAAAAGAPGP